MPNKEPATETIVPAIAPGGDTTPILEDDVEARFQQLETEKENYRKAYLKSESKNKGTREEIDPEEAEGMEGIARKVLAESRLAEIAREQQAIIEKALKENKELKLAQMNKKEPPAVAGTHTESTPVRDTVVTPEQMAYFKSKNWSDKDIEQYKRNLGKRI